MGIDPGLAATGWGVIETAAGRPRYVAGGVIRTSVAAAHTARLGDIYRRTAEVARRTAPALAGVERVFANVNGKSTMALGEARGAAIAALSECDIVIAEVSALQIKKAVTGAGRADKKQVAGMIPLLLDGAPKKLENDAADALACALTVAPLLRLSRVNEHFRLPPSRPRRRASRR
ncbi:MAG: crossover junction endodeoxyribonuclease RuvC [Gammaproteobacteria bacterium]